MRVVDKDYDEHGVADALIRLASCRAPPPTQPLIISSRSGWERPSPRPSAEHQDSASSSTSRSRHSPPSRSNLLKLPFSPPRIESYSCPPCCANHLIHGGGSPGFVYLYNGQYTYSKTNQEPPITQPHDDHEEDRQPPQKNTREKRPRTVTYNNHDRLTK